MLNRLLPVGSMRRQIVKRWFLDPKVPSHLSNRFIPLDESRRIAVEDALRQNYFAKNSTDYLASEAFQKEMRIHLEGRLDLDRRFTIPWLDHARPLAGARVLEIGCGTGCSTIALAEQGAQVVAVDIDVPAMTVARKRCAVYGFDAEFVTCSATEVGNHLSGRNFDFIIFWACLEHLTITERLESMEATWQMLPSGGLWCVTDTPNRLWFYDDHTSLLPFFMWLPDRLAMQFLRFSPRAELKDALTAADVPDDELRFARWGRGVSFHEFSLAMEPAEKLDIVSCLEVFRKSQRIFSRLAWSLSTARRYESFLRKAGPAIHRGFYQPYLDLIIRKP